MMSDDLLKVVGISVVFKNVNNQAQNVDFSFRTHGAQVRRLSSQGRVDVSQGRRRRPGDGDGDSRQRRPGAVVRVLRARVRSVRPAERRVVLEAGVVELDLPGRGPRQGDFVAPDVAPEARGRRPPAGEAPRDEARPRGVSAARRRRAVQLAEEEVARLLGVALGPALRPRERLLRREGRAVLCVPEPLHDVPPLRVRRGRRGVRALRRRRPSRERPERAVLLRLHVPLDDDLPGILEEEAGPLRHGLGHGGLRGGGEGPAGVRRRPGDGDDPFARRRRGGDLLPPRHPRAARRRVLPRDRRRDPRRVRRRLLDLLPRHFPVAAVDRRAPRPHEGRLEAPPELQVEGHHHRPRVHGADPHHGEPLLRRRQGPQRLRKPPLRDPVRGRPHRQDLHLHLRQRLRVLRLHRLHPPRPDERTQRGVAREQPKAPLPLPRRRQLHGRAPDPALDHLPLPRPHLQPQGGPRPLLLLGAPPPPPAGHGRRHSKAPTTTTTKTTTTKATTQRLL
mmetsp:Transcript_9190/g.29825  ORF Transcript_9190/g.29825 Transcript_9190/m.29825 type:complete len:506 (-) Transcript_9190:33-1550(-)